MNFSGFARSTGLLPLSGELGERVLAVQYNHLKNHIPLLYLTIGFYLVMAIVFITRQIPEGTDGYFAADYVLPFIVLPFSVFRAMIWYYRRHDVFDKEKVVKTIINLTLISSLISIMCSYWAVTAWSTGSTDQRFYVPLIMAMGGFSVAYCLAIIPFAAALNLVLILLPLNLIMLASGETFLAAVAATVTMAMIYLVGLLRRHHTQMIQMIKLQIEMHDLANTDMLTGLLNRRALMEEFAIAVHGDTHSVIDYLDPDDEVDGNWLPSITMMMMDLDGFKPVNDVYGHAAGDEILKIIANRMREHIGEYGTIARIGGDEFVVMFVNKPYQFCKRTVKLLSNLLSEPYVVDNIEHHVGISYGLAHSLDGKQSMEKLLSDADKALYEMKLCKERNMAANVLKHHTH